jgi:hypothetical protein
MKFVVLLLLLPLTACTTADTSGITSLVNALSKDHCTSNLTYQAQVGALNPGSGLSISGSINCPAVAPTGTTLVSTSAPMLAFVPQESVAHAVLHEGVLSSSPILTTPTMQWSPSNPSH